MRRLLLIILLASIASAAAGHEPGFSEMTVCGEDAAFQIDWKLEAEDVAYLPEQDLARANGAWLEPESTEEDDGSMILHWRVAGAAGSIDVRAIAALRHGHRVLVLDCNGNALRVLSAKAPELPLDFRSS